MMAINYSNVQRGSESGLIFYQNVNAALDGAYREAEALLRSRLGDVTLAALSQDFHRRMAAGCHSPEDIA